MTITMTDEEFAKSDKTVEEMRSEFLRDVKTSSEFYDATFDVEEVEYTTLQGENK